MHYEKISLFWPKKKYHQVQTELNLNICCYFAIQKKNLAGLNHFHSNESYNLWIFFFFFFVFFFVIVVQLTSEYKYFTGLAINVA